MRTWRLLRLAPAAKVAVKEDQAHRLGIVFRFSVAVAALFVIGGVFFTEPFNAVLTAVVSRIVASSAPQLQGKGELLVGWVSPRS